MRQVGADGSDAWRELCVINQGARSGIGEQEGELVLDVAVADIEGCYSGAIAGDHGLEVFGAVAQINSQVVLPGFVPRQILSVGMAAQPRSAQVSGEAVDTAINRAICQAAFAPHQHFLIRNSAGDGGEDRRQVEDGGTVHGVSWLWLGQGCYGRPMPGIAARSRRMRPVA